MLENIINIDHSITLFFNSVQTPFRNSVMLFFSSHTVWIPMYVLIAAAMFFRKIYGRKSIVQSKYDNLPIWIAGLLGLVVAATCFGTSDQICNVIKHWVERPRPGNTPVLEGLLNLPEGRGGGFSFISAHAANTMSFAVLTSLYFRRKGYTVAMVAWSLIVGFSRIYLSKHFMTDVVCGFLTGAFIGGIFYYLYTLCLQLIYKHNRKKLPQTKLESD